MTPIADGQGIRARRCTRTAASSATTRAGPLAATDPWQKPAGAAGGSGCACPAFSAASTTRTPTTSGTCRWIGQRHRYLQFLVTRAHGLVGLEYRLRYWAYRRWLFHGQFNNQDGAMVGMMSGAGPERLFRPDASITAWRRLCEHARGTEPAAAPARRAGCRGRRAGHAGRRGRY